MQIKADKQLGQHFLFQNQIILKIAEVLPNDVDQIIEIGSGTGNLTEALLNIYDRVHAIELDPRLIKRLQERFSEQIKAEKLILLQQDILSFSWEAVLDTKKKTLIVGNLPYNISTKIIKHLSRFKDMTESMVFLVQKEVAERIVHDGFERNIKSYGSFSVFMQLLFHTKKCFDVPPDAFEPPPKVQSTLIALQAKKTIIDNEIDFLSFVQRLFENRRKRFLSNLQKIHPSLFDQIDPETKLQWHNYRAENIKPNEYLDLYNIAMKE